MLALLAPILETSGTSPKQQVQTLLVGHSLVETTGRIMMASMQMGMG